MFFEWYNKVNNNTNINVINNNIIKKSLKKMSENNKENYIKILR